MISTKRRRLEWMLEHRPQIHPNIIRASSITGDVCITNCYYVHRQLTVIINHIIIQCTLVKWDAQGTEKNRIT